MQEENHLLVFILLIVIVYCSSSVVEALTSMYELNCSKISTRLYFQQTLPTKAVKTKKPVSMSTGQENIKYIKINLKACTYTCIFMTACKLSSNLEWEVSYPERISTAKMVNFYYQTMDAWKQQFYTLVCGMLVLAVLYHTT